MSKERKLAGGFREREEQRWIQFAPDGWNKSANCSIDEGKERTPPRCLGAKIVADAELKMMDRMVQEPTVLAEPAVALESQRAPGPGLDAICVEDPNEQAILVRGRSHNEVTAILFNAETLNAQQKSARWGSEEQTSAFTAFEEELNFARGHHRLMAANEVAAECEFP